MIRTLSTILRLQVTSFANRFLYFLQRLPIIGKLVSDAAYSVSGVKRALHIVCAVLFVLWGFLKHLLYVWLIVGLPVIAWNSSPERQSELFWHIYFMLSFIVAGVTNIKVLEPSRSKYISVKLMRIPATRYMRATLGYRYIAFFLQLLPVLMVAAYWVGDPHIRAVWAAAAIVGWRVCCEFLHLMIYRKTGIVLVKHMPIGWSVIFIGYAAAYAPLVFDSAPVFGHSILFSMPLTAISIAAGVVSWTLLMFKTDYRDAVDASTQRDDPLIDLGRVMTEARSNAVKAKDSDYDQSAADAETAKFQAKQGYAYLNAIFFSRHRSLVRRPFMMRLALIAGVGAALILLARIYPERAQTFADVYREFLPVWLFIMSLATVGEQMCKAMFYHCDLKLLRYRFYREDAAEHFRIRLVRLLGMNAAIALLLSFFLILTLIAIGNIDPALMMLSVVCIIALGVFFSVHPLLLYYLFQPYTTELNAKNPFFYVFNWLITIVYVISISLRPDPFVFTCIVTAVSLIYLIAAPLLVQRFGPGNFRIK